MKTKLLCVALATVILMLTLSSCIGNLFHFTHEFGEWRNESMPTCVQDGVKVRECKCGEKQSQAIPMLGHSEENGICANCQEVLDPYKALADLIKTKGEDIGESYTVLTGGSAFIAYSGGSIILLHIVNDGTSSANTSITLNEGAETQTVKIVFKSPAGTDSASAEIYGATFYDTKSFYNFKSLSSSGYLLEDVVPEFTDIMLKNVSAILKENDSPVTLEMLGIKGYDS